MKQAIQDTVIKTGLRIEQVAKETAPVDTGNYRSQINYDGSNTVTANAEYSAAIEYGLDKEILVKPHQRVITQAFGEQLKNPVIADVKLHTRQVFRERNPVMRNAAAKVQKEIPQIFKEAQKANGL